MNKKTKNRKKQPLITDGKTAVLFNPFTEKSNDILIHYLRIPDIMARVIAAREILKKYKIQPPVWMFGLTSTDKDLNIPTHFQLISFLVSIGLYDRLVRLMGTPDFLIGDSQALFVSAQVTTFEKSVINIFCNATQKTYQIKKKKNTYKGNSQIFLQKLATLFTFQPDFLKIYQKKQSKTLSFSLLHSLDTLNSQSLHSIRKTYGIKHYVLISPISHNKIEKKEIISSALTVDILVEMDSQLAWFWPILKQNQLKSDQLSARSFSH